MIKSLVPNTLNARLSLYYALAFLLCLGLAFTALYWSVNTVFNQQLDEDLVEDIEELSALLDDKGIERIKQEIDYEAQGAEGDSVFLRLYSNKGELIYRSRDSAWQGLELDQDQILAQTEPGAEPFLQTVSLQSQDAETRIIYGAVSAEHIMVVGESLEEREDVMEILLLAFAAVFLVAIPLASILVWYLTRRAVRGIEAVSRAASDIKRGDLARRVGVHNQLNEVQTLADTFDAMAERIQTLIKNMREMTDNMAHDLRSPLGRVRVLSESILRPDTSKEESQQIAESTINECDRLIKMINTSLDVAEAEAGIACMQKERLKFCNIVDDTCDLFEPVIEQKNIHMQIELKKDCQIQGDKSSLQRMLANLFDNAIKFTPAGGTISIHMYQDEQTVRLTIRDNGIGIPDSDLPFIFNRFYRCDQSRTSNGCGLGLSYARAVARDHGGDIRVSSVEGEFSEFTVELPKVLKTSAPSLEVPAPSSNALS